MRSLKHLQLRLTALASIWLRFPSLCSSPAGANSQQIKFSGTDYLGRPATESIEQDGIVYEAFSHPSFLKYRLRIKEPTICDSSVKQYSGYLDVAEDRHLFFWYFESRTSPKEDPLVLWMNGGPGCSSTTGLLFEMGPCTVINEGAATKSNPYSWNTRTNMIFLDQPVNVGYSYATSRSTPINTVPLAANDVYVFLQLFISRFSKYKNLPFHIAAEGYGGIYAPNLARIIHKKNYDLFHALPTGLKKINLESVLIGNGLTNPLIQMPSIVEFACSGWYDVLDPKGRTCRSMRRQSTTCERLIKSCYHFDNRATCVLAGETCWSLFNPVASSGRNIYDLRLPCDPSEDKDGPLCYKEMKWIEKYMNDPEVMKGLGATPKKPYAACNFDLTLEFRLQGDGMRNTASLLPELINDGIRLLVYSGTMDLVWNRIGEERWIGHLPSNFHHEFSYAQPIPWVTLDSKRTAGTLRAAGSRGIAAGNLTFVLVHDAGHMVPHDQPEAALDLFTRWIMNVPLY